MYKIAPELKEVLRQLISEGKEVYSYTQGCERRGEITSLFWWEGNRMLDIQPSSWYHSEYARDRFNLGVDYVPDRHTGSGCRLSPEKGMGTPASELLKYRNKPTWVRGAKHWKSLEDWLKHQTVLDWFQVTVWHLLYEGE